MTVVTRWPTSTSGEALPPESVEASDDALASGIEVIRIRAPVERRDAGLWARVLAQLRFSLSALRTGRTLAKRHDMVLAYTPPPFLAVAARLSAGLRRRPFVLEVQDLYPMQAVGLGLLRPGPHVALAKAVERDLYRAARRVIVVTEGYRHHVRQAAGGAVDVQVLPNSCDVTRFNPTVPPLDDGISPRQVNVVFAGTLGLAQGLDVVLDAAEHLLGRADIGFELFGRGARRAELEAAARIRKLHNVRFGEAVPHSTMPSVMARAGILLLTLHAHPVFRNVVPSKLSEYLAMGRPVLAAARGAVEEVINARGAGLTVAPGDGRALADAVLRLADDPVLRARMGEAARELAVGRFDDRVVLPQCARTIIEAGRSPNTRQS